MKKFLLGAITGVIALGIISSALWDKALQPLADLTFKFLLNVATLGLKKYRNSIYIEISKGFH